MGIFNKLFGKKEPEFTPDNSVLLELIQTYHQNKTIYKKINDQLIYLLIFSSIGLNFQIYAQQVETVQIGNQHWTTKNLEVVTFKNGDSIPEAQTDAEWKKAYLEGQPAWCYLYSDATNGVKYGKLYNWFAVTDQRGLAPEGFHIPSKDEWASLVEFLGGQQLAGRKLKCEKGWPNEGNGTNEVGFCGLPGCMRHYSGYFTPITRYGHWWTTTHLEPFYAWQYYLLSTGDDIGWYSIGFDKGTGLSVRCLRD